MTRERILYLTKHWSDANSNEEKQFLSEYQFIRYKYANQYPYISNQEFEHIINSWITYVIQHNNRYNFDITKIKYDKESKQWKEK